VGEQREYLIDNCNALIAEAGDPNSFADKIIFSINNFGIIEEIGQNGKRTAEQNFDIKNQAIRIEKYLLTL